jgi:CheY-like chemotaxis protein
MAKICLVIDDDLIMQKLLSRILNRLGFETLTALGAMQAEEILAQGTVDLITCDLMMPDVSGLDLLKKIKSIPDLKNIPVIMVSALDNQPMIEEALAVGTVDAIGKPFSIAQVEQSIKKLFPNP